MLDRCKLIKELQSVSDKLFIDLSHEIGIAKEIWDKISKDPKFKERAQSIQNKSHWGIPDWQGDLGDVFEVKQKLDQYVVLAVDGSQIYPDKHSGTLCHLINIGCVGLNYGVLLARALESGMPGASCVPSKSVFLSSEPHVFSDLELADLAESPTEVVNCKRQDLELIAGFELAKSYASCLSGAHLSGNNLSSTHTNPLLFLFDGSIIFWHLESKSPEVKKRFLASYLKTMESFYENKILMAGYISLTKSKEIVNLIRAALCNFDMENCQAYKSVDRLVDAVIASFYLKPFQRTTIFKNNSKITQYYPDHLQPHFFYMNVGDEIVRIEIPAWIACDDSAVDLVANIIADQVFKGMGYPVCLAEAHEQAVVKGPDREFFYHLITKIGFEQNHRSAISLKSRKKLGMGV